MEPIREITREALVEQRRRGEAFILVDVLRHEQYEHIHLPGAINLPLPVLRELAPLVLGTHDMIVVYCTNIECTASPTAYKILTQMGFTNVYDYSGGLQDWLNGHLPVMHHDDEPSAPAQEAA